MPATDALMGEGMAAQLANRVGGIYQLLAGVGTAQVGAGKILAKNVEVTASAGQTAIVAPTGFPIYEEINLFNSSTTGALVFPPVGDYMNGVQNASVTLPSVKSGTVYQYKPHYWCSNISS